MTSLERRPEFATATAAVNEVLKGYVTADDQPSRQTILQQIAYPVGPTGVLAGALVGGIAGVAAGVVSLIWSLIAGAEKIDAVQLALILAVGVTLLSTAIVMLVPLPTWRLDRSATSWWSVSQWGRESDTSDVLSREAKLARLAGDLSEQILNHPGWRSDWLDSHRLRLNPEQEAEQIVTQAQEICKLRRSVAALAAVGSSDDTAGAQREAALDEASGNLLNRVIALQAYVEQLDHVQVLTQALGGGAVDNSIDARIDRLVGTSARDEFAADRLLSLREEIKFTTGSILEILK